MSIRQKVSGIFFTSRIFPLAAIAGILFHSFLFVQPSLHLAESSPANIEAMGILTVQLEKIENLRDADLIGKSDPYVQFYLEQDKKVFDKGFGRKESSKKKDELSPVYNEMFSWELEGMDTLENM